MCEVLDRIEAKGREEGYAFAISQMRATGKDTAFIASALGVSEQEVLASEAKGKPAS